MGPSSAFYRGDSGDFVSGKDSLSIAELQWGGERRTEKGKTFPLIGNANLFYFALQELHAIIRSATG
jgi:hypothetical protein